MARKVVFGGYEGDASGIHVTQNLVQGVGLKAIFTFEEVPLQVNKLSLIELKAWTSPQDYFFSFKLRDIPVSN